MRSNFCAAVINKVKWVVKLSKKGILPLSHLHLGTEEYTHIQPKTHPPKEKGK